MFKTKLIISKHYVESYSYNQTIGLPLCSAKRFGQRQRSMSLAEKSACITERVIERDDNKARTARTIKRIVDCNLDRMLGFLTLTYAETLQDNKKSSSNISLFFKRLSYFLRKNVAYIGVLEYQERGAIHYHFLVDFAKIDFDKLRSIWGLGRFHFQSLDKSEPLALIGYLTKYITKSDSVPYGYRRLFCSRGLDKPLVLIDSLADLFMVGWYHSIFPVFELLFQVPHTVDNFCKYVIYKYNRTLESLPIICYANNSPD